MLSIEIMSKVSTNNFKLAISDYKYLLNRGYPEKASLKLVGDRYRLDRTARNCLFRGVVKKEISKTRKYKLVPAKAVKHSSIGIDWYNVLITVESYLKGNLLFISEDGILRDSAGVHGSYKRNDITERAIEIIAGALSYLSPGKIDIFLDAPISHSGEMGTHIKEKLEEKNLPNITVKVLKSADYPLKSYQGIVATSDSVIMDNVSRIFDLPRYALRREFNYLAPRLNTLEITTKNNL